MTCTSCGKEIDKASSISGGTGVGLQTLCESCTDTRMAQAMTLKTPEELKAIVKKAREEREKKARPKRGEKRVSPCQRCGRSKENPRAKICDACKLRNPFSSDNRGSDADAGDGDNPWHGLANRQAEERGG